MLKQTIWMQSAKIQTVENHRSNDQDSSMNKFPGEKRQRWRGETLDQNKLIRHDKSGFLLFYLNLLG